MRKLIFVIALIGVIFISGCIGDSTGMAISETESEIDSGVIYHNSECGQDTDCIMVYCSETPEDLHCMCSVDMLVEFKCTGKGRLVSIKDYVICGCKSGACQKI